VDKLFVEFLPFCFMFLYLDWWPHCKGRITCGLWGTFCSLLLYWDWGYAGSPIDDTPHYVGIQCRRLQFHQIICLFNRDT